MAFAAVQRSSRGGATANLSMGAGDGWATPAAGNLIVVTANSDGVVSLTGYTAGPSVVDGNGAYMWYKVAAGTESTVTLTNGANKTAMTVCEYSGNTATPFDAQNSSTIAGSSGTTTTATSVTTTAAGDLVVVAAMLHSGGTPPTTPAWTNSFVNQLSPASGGATSADVSTFYGELVAGAAGAYSTSCSWTNVMSDRQQLILAFKAAAGGGASVAPDGISVPVALGSPSLAWSGSVAPDGIAAPVALGSPTAAVQGSAAPDGIGVPVALGDPTLTWSGGVAPDGLSVPVALGAPTVGAASVAPDGLPVPVALGDPTVTWLGSIAPDGISAPVALGSPIIGAASIAPDGIAVPVALGSPLLAWSGAVSPDGISVPVAIGAPSLTIPGAVITRPDTGTAGRPATGTITRPDTGIVIHILTVVVRLYTGTVSRP